MEPIVLRPLTREDLPQLASLVAERNVHAREYERWLGFEGAQGMVLEVEGRVVAAVTAMRYFEHGFVGPVLMAPDAEGVGTRIALLSQIVRSLQQSGVPFVEAEATEGDAEVLVAMGFRKVRGTVVMERAPSGPGRAGATREMGLGDLLDVGALDAAVVGYGRKDFIAALREDFPEGARVLERDGEVVGYALVRESKRGYHLGPLVTRGEDPALADALLADVIALAGTSAVVALSPEGGLVDALLRAGFEPVGELVRLRAGEPPEARMGATEWLVGSRITG